MTLTTTDDTRVGVDETVLARGRELSTGGQLPSKRELQKHLRKGWDIVNAVYARLDEEARQERLERRSRRRSAMRRLPSRKRSGTVSRKARPRSQTVNEPLRRRAATWPIFLLALPAFVAIWSGWVDLGRLTGFGVVHLLPGILDDFALDTAITLPVGLETYAAYALYVWLSGAVPPRARQFAKWSAIGSLALGAAGQVAYHLMVAAGMDRAPWQITTIVACLPVAVLGMGAALRHLVHGDQE